MYAKPLFHGFIPGSGSGTGIFGRIRERNRRDSLFSWGRNMPIIEQMLFGVNTNSDSGGRTVLAQSPGMGGETTVEIARLCENWGTAPPLGLEHPALMSFRLKSTIPSLAGNLFTVIKVSRGLNPLFHAVVMSEGTFATFERNPYAVAQAVTFCSEWIPDLQLQVEEIDYDNSVPLVNPPGNKGDIGLVDEAVLKLISEKKLSMPIEQPMAQSDRCMALIIACIPEKDRKNLRFASFSPSESNNYTLVGMYTEGCVFAGWQRMMMAWMAGEYVDEVETYIAQVRDFLAAGDMAGINRVSQRHLFRSKPVAEKISSPRIGTVSATMPVKGTSRAPSRPLRSLPDTPVVRTPVPRTPANNRTPGPVMDTKPPKRGPVKKKMSGSVTVSRRRIFSRTKLIRVASLVLILALSYTAMEMWQEGKTLAESLEWANLQAIMGEKPRTERAATLLEVIDVGDVYARQLKLMTGSGKGLNQSVDKGRIKALGNLREEAAVPLSQQVKLFAKLAGDGIQQGSRPDRESQRMRALANQGLVLENELARLELAWYSLAANVLWEDLSSIPDNEVIARRDSLVEAEKGVLDEADLDLGTQETRAVLNQAQGNVNGMASLLTLFEAKSWSLGWEKELLGAAGKVSTSASPMTRAYANSAFAFLRLKKAERKGAQKSLPYRRELKDQGWPSAEIRSNLSNLRAQRAMFKNGPAPSLLTSTIDLYSALENPVSLAAQAEKSQRVLADLAANRAVRFHPEAYEDFLERIRYEAALLGLNWADDPEMIGDHLYSGADRELVIRFRDTMTVHHSPEAWESLVASAGIPFLAHWAGHLGALAQAQRTSARGEFDTAWVECRKTAVKLQGEVAAGRDWTKTWLALNGQTHEILAAHALAMADDLDRARKIEDITNLAVALKASLPLGLKGGTIRLDQDSLQEPTKAVMEIQVVPGGEVWRSDIFYIGPAAPEGVGWVGTVSLDKTLGILPRQGLEIKIIADKEDEVLLAVTCPPLAEGTGPGGMVRPRSGDRGSVSLKIEQVYWKSLRVPDLGAIF